MNKNYKILAGLLMLVVMISCKQEYNPDLKTNSKNLLVVEGFINSGQGPTTIHLSRTADLQDTVSPRAELHATVRVEGDDGSIFLLTGDTHGNYSNAQLSLSASVKYRLYIKTSAGKEYASGYEPVKYTPDIDSVSWQRDNDGVRFYVNTHDPQNNTKYYLWKYEETWEFHSAYPSTLEYKYSPLIHVEYRYPDKSTDTLIYKCWQTVNSSSILIGSSENLTEDIIKQPFHFIERGSEKISVLYSINLRQFALSHEAYLFYQKLKKNTEQVGTIFDAQPSQLSGNIHGITDPAETVIGYVEINQEKDKRIFIKKDQVPDWNYSTSCYFIEIPNDPDSIYAYGGDALLPAYTAQEDPLGTILSFYAAPPTCVDCSLTHSNQRPSFWP